MRRAPDPDQGALFAPVAEPEPVRQAMDPRIPMGNHAYVAADAPATSVDAATAALPRSGTQRARVLETIRQAGPAGRTDQEIATALGLAENSVRPRRLELVSPPDGTPRLVFDSGTKRPTAAGGDATVWVTAEHGKGVAP